MYWIFRPGINGQNDRGERLDTPLTAYCLSELGKPQCWPITTTKGRVEHPDNAKVTPGKHELAVTVIGNKRGLAKHRLAKSFRGPKATKIGPVIRGLTARSITG